MSATKIQLEARKPSDYERREVNQNFINWELNELSLTDLFLRMFFSAYIAGKGYMKTGWKYEKPLEISVDGSKRVVMREIVNRAEAKFVRFNDLLIPNRNIPLLEDQPYLLEVVTPTIGELIADNETMGEEMWDKKWLEDIKKKGVNSQIKPEYRIEAPISFDMESELAYRSCEVPMVRMQTKDNDVLYVPMGDERVVNKNQENQYWHGHYPYLDFTPFPEDDEFYAVSIVEIIADLQIGATEILNQTMTNIRQINNNMWIVGSDAEQTPDHVFYSRPNGVIRVVGDTDQVQPVRIPDNTVPAMKMAGELQTKIERASGISSLYASGAPSTSVNQTARGAQIIDANIDTNMRMILDLFGSQVLKKLGEHFLELNAQYVTEDQSFFVTGKRGMRDLVQVTPEQISANFNVYVNSERMMKQTPASRQASLQNLLTILVQNAPAAGVVLDATPIIEALVDSYPEMENVDRVVISVDEKAQADIAMIERLQMPEIKSRDMHQELMQAVSVHLTSAQYEPEVMMLFEEYLQGHMKYLVAAQEVSAMTKPQMPQATGSDQLQNQMTGNDPMSDQAGLPDQGYDLGTIV